MPAVGLKKMGGFWGVVMIFWVCGVVLVGVGGIGLRCGWDWFEKNCKFWIIFGGRVGGRRAPVTDRGRQPGRGIGRSGPGGASHRACGS